MLLEGIFAAVTTCFYPDGRPYWRKLEANIDRYSLTAMSGMVLLGSTGEAVMLSDEESREALRVARNTAAPEKVLSADRDAHPEYAFEQHQVGRLRPGPVNGRDLNAEVINDPLGCWRLQCR